MKLENANKISEGRNRNPLVAAAAIIRVRDACKQIMSLLLSSKAENDTCQVGDYFADISRN